MEADLERHTFVHCKRWKRLQEPEIHHGHRVLFCFTHASKESLRYFLQAFLGLSCLYHVSEIIGGTVQQQHPCWLLDVRVCRGRHLMLLRTISKQSTQVTPRFLTWGSLCQNRIAIVGKGWEAVIWNLNIELWCALRAQPFVCVTILAPLLSVTTMNWESLEDHAVAPLT